MPYEDKPLVWTTHLGQDVPIPQHEKADGTMALTGEKNPLPIQQVESFVKDTFTGEHTVQRKYAQDMEYLEIQNTGTDPLTITVNGLAIPLDSGEGFAEKFAPFNTISITGNSRYKGFVKNKNSATLPPPTNVFPSISDTFSGTTFGTTDTGQTYTYDGDLANPVWSVAGGKAQVTNADGSKVTCALIDVGTANAKIKSDITMSGGTANYPGLVLNFVDNNNHILIRGDSTSGLKVMRKASGAWSTLTSFPLTIVDGTTYTIEATSNNKFIEVKVNGTTSGTFTMSDTQYNPVKTGTKFGIAVKDTGARHDNLVIQPL